MNKKVLGWSLVVALGGFLFGFDTAVISGAEQSIQQYWNLSVFEHGLTISIALIGTVLGAALGSIPSEALGRKKTLLLIAAIYLLSSLGTSLATNWYLFMLCRFIGGIGVGASSVTAPIYISEVSPAPSRGRMVGMFQFMVVFGILVSYLSNYIIGSDGEHSWRWMLGIQAVPSFIFLIALRTVPESPRWLILKKGNITEATRVLRIINPEGYENDLQKIQADKETRAGQMVAESIFQKKYFRPIFLAVAFAMFNQLSGINAIIYFAPRIFEMTGLGRQSALLSSVGIGIVNFLFTLIAMTIIDRFGRRKLMFVGSIGLVIALGIVAYAFYTDNFAGMIVPIMLLVYIAFFAFSQGAVIWVFISEIFPNAVRAQGQTLGSLTHWVMAALLTFFFPALSEMAGGGNTFAFFCVMMVLQLIFVVKFMPETKGKSLEDIENTVILH